MESPLIYVMLVLLNVFVFSSGIIHNKDIAAIEQWMIKITMHEGLNIYETDGTLLDLVRGSSKRPEEAVCSRGQPWQSFFLLLGSSRGSRVRRLCLTRYEEPILQWNLGRIIIDSEMDYIYDDVREIVVTKSPCANDVALIGLNTRPSSSGLFIGKTVSGFWTFKECKWYELTDLIFAEIDDEYQVLTAIDLVLTNHFLVILTNLGLYVSSDLRYPTTSRLKLSRVEFCGFERDDYKKGKLWYNEKCFANRESFEVDYVTVTFKRNRTLSESSSCFFSKEPFLQWLPCAFSTYKNERSVPRVIAFLIDQETQSGVYLFHMQDTKETYVTVAMLKDGKPSPRPKFPSFQFPSTFVHPVGMVFHPRSHFLYVYGNQIWISMDGGNTFEMLCDLFRNYIKMSSHSFYTSDIVFIGNDGRIFMTKAVF